MNRFRVLTLLGNLLLCVVTCALPVRGKPTDDVAPVKSQYSSSQWRELTSVQFVPLILPSYLPPGFRVVSSRRDNRSAPSQHTPLLDGFTVTYGNDKGQTITWSMTNAMGGGDAMPNAFQYAFHSKILGDSVVKIDDQRKCWYSSSLFSPVGGTSSGIFSRQSFATWNIETCNNAPPGELAKVAQSMIRVGPGVFIDYNGLRPAAAAWIRTGLRKDAEVFQRPRNECSARRSASIRNGALVYVAFENDGQMARFDCDGSVAVPRKNGQWILIYVVSDRLSGFWVTKAENVSGK
jgi:hypothetical protein